MSRTFLLIALGVLLVLGACAQFNLIGGISGAAVIEECEALSKESLQDSCYAQFGIARADINLCDSVNADESRFYCYDGVAEATNASSICAQITDNYWRPICFSNVGINTGNVALCNEVSDSSTKMECFNTIARNTNNATICRQITDNKPNQIGCLTSIAVAQKSVHPCFDIERNTLERDQCLYKVAKAVPDPSLCNHLDFTDTRQICFERAKEIADKQRAAKAMNQSQDTLNLTNFTL